MDQQIDFSNHKPIYLIRKRRQSADAGYGRNRALPLEFENDWVVRLQRLKELKRTGKDFKEKLGLAESFIKEGKLGWTKQNFCLSNKVKLMLYE